MNEQLVSFKVAKLAKEKGFFFKTPQFYPTENPHSYHKDLKGRGILGLLHEGSLYEEYIDRDEESGLLFYQLNPGIISAPTQSLLQKWIREEHNIHISIWYNSLTEKWRIDYIIDISTDNEFNPNRDIEYKTYEQALEAGLLAGLKLIK